MYLEQFVRSDIGCASYLIGSTETGEAAAIDPRIDLVDEILAAAEREGLSVRYVVETHTHADHVSGHHEIAKRTGAVIAIQADAGVEYHHLPLCHGQELELGEVRLRVIHTPGHRPEHIALAVIDGSRGNEPWAVFTGDSLFIGEVARPDLAVAGVVGSRALFHSLHERLLTLPDGTLVYPTHVSGSLCGRVTNRMTVSTTGFERRNNPALAIANEDEFVRFTTTDLPVRPPNLGRIVALNQAVEAFTPAEPAPISIREFARQVAAGAIVLDVRSPAEFSRGHVPGAIAVHLDGGQFQNRVGLVIPPERDLLLIAQDSAEARRTAQSLAVIGFDQIGGYLEGGMPAWREDGRGVEILTSVPAADLDRLLRADPSLLLIDVRERSEWDDGHIEGAVHIPFHEIRARLDQLPAERPVALICGGGTRSVIAASILRAYSRQNITNIEDGMDGWRAAGFPTVAGDLVPAGAY